MGNRLIHVLYAVAAVAVVAIERGVTYAVPRSAAVESTPVCHLRRTTADYV